MLLCAGGGSLSSVPAAVPICHARALLPPATYLAAITSAASLLCCLGCLTHTRLSFYALHTGRLPRQSVPLYSLEARHGIAASPLNSRRLPAMAYPLSYNSTTGQTLCPRLFLHLTASLPRYLPCHVIWEGYHTWGERHAQHAPRLPHTSTGIFCLTPPLLHLLIVDVGRTLATASSHPPCASCLHYQPHLRLCLFYP